MNTAMYANIGYESPHYGKISSIFIEKMFEKQGKTKQVIFLRILKNCYVLIFGIYFHDNNLVHIDDNYLC